MTDATNVGAAGAFMKSVDDTDDITVGATNKFATAAEKTKLGHITVTQAVDLDTMESDIAGKQPLDSDLTSWAAITRAAGFDTFVATPSGANLAALITSALPASKGGTGLTALAANIVSLLGAADYAAVRTLLGLVIGTNVQAYDADLATIAGLTATTDNFMIANSSAWASRTPAQAAATLQVEIGKLMYPVGCIYTSVNSTNPNTSLGFGTWTAFGAGRVPVGFSSGETEFDTDEETGGAKTVTLTSAQSGVPAHTHPKAAGSEFYAYFGSGGNLNAAAGTNAGTMGANTGANTAADAASAHNNLQPYIVVRMWKRTA